MRAPSPFLAVMVMVLSGCAVVKAGGDLVGGTVRTATVLTTTVAVGVATLGYGGGSAAMGTAVGLAEAGGRVAVVTGGVGFKVTALAVKLSSRGAIVLGDGAIDLTPVVVAYVVKHPDVLLHALSVAGFPPGVIHAIELAVRAQRAAEEFQAFVRHAALDDTQYQIVVRRVTSSYWMESGLPGDVGPLEFRQKDGGDSLIVTVDAPTVIAD